MDNRARAAAADLHDRLIGFRSSAGGPFRGFGRRMDGMEAQVSSHSPLHSLLVRSSQGWPLKGPIVKDVRAKGERGVHPGGPKAK